MMFVDFAAVAGQSVTELEGTAATSSALSAASPEVVSPASMGADEDTIAFSAAVSAHGGQFLGSTEAGALQREAFGATVGLDGVAFAAMNAMNAVGLTA